jgi:hypothetical protein
MAYSNIAKVIRGYRRWNIPALQRLPGVTEDGMAYSAIPPSVTPGNLCNVGMSFHLQ